MLTNKSKFWLLFIFLNCLLFLPKYLIEASSDSFFPFEGFLHGSFFERFKYLFVRYNYDIFRVSVDLFIIVSIFYIFRQRINPKKYAWFAGVYYVIMWLFIIYYVVIEKIYLVKPVLYDDWFLFKLGFINSGGNFSVVLIAELAVLILIVWFFVSLFGYFFKLLKEIEFGRKSKIVLGVIVVFFAINSVKSGITFEPHHVFQTSIAMMVDNAQYSVDAYKNLRAFNSNKLNAQMNYDGYQLKKRPNVYFLFIESYGRIVYQNPALSSNYLKLMDDCNKTLAANGFSTRSAFSTAPVSGGGSWISYGSVMYGFNLKNQATYLSLLKNTETSNYNHLYRWFHKKGYRNYRLIAIPDNENLKVPWAMYSRFYGADEWIRFKDLNYHGNQYGFGPSPPDQYSISFANEYIQNKGVEPYTLFFISQNTHNPFYCPDSVVADWKSLNHKTAQKADNSVFLKKPKLDDYSKAIEYNLKTFVQFIVKEGKPNDIFFLIGDHQPPILTQKDDGFDTPVHIIARDSSFVAGFGEYGFSPGMRVSQSPTSIKHHAIYSMFMREFVRNYGVNNTHLPTYLPDGLKPGAYDEK